MADRPILFSAPMVRALLEGRKTQTRRILKPQPHLMSANSLSYFGTDGKGHELRMRVGDRLYVREHWRTSGSLDSTAPRDLPRTAALLYNVDEDRPVWAGKHRQAMHMPRWASRLTLTVTDVRVERLQDISEADAIDEGIEGYSGMDPECAGYINYANNSDDGYWINPKASYASLWNLINGPDAWGTNPYVAAYTFTVHHGNIDQIGGD